VTVSETKTTAKSHRWRVVETDSPKSTTLYVPWRMSRCDECDALMVPRGLRIDSFGAGLWERAREAMGIVPRYDGDMDDGRIVCAPCAEAGGATFECALCHVQRTFDLEHDSWGDPAERLCEPCYETVPAKVWTEKTADLHEAHRYDFE
jgi:hypothetical protein